jgi:hypothetical protein
MYAKTIVVDVTFKKIGLLLKWMEKKRGTTIIELKVLIFFLPSPPFLCMYVGCNQKNNRV